MRWAISTEIRRFVTIKTAMKRSAQVLVLVLISCVLALLLAEGITRIIRPISTVQYRVDPEVGQILEANQRARWVDDDYDVEVLTNSAGFHDVEHETDKPRGRYRIVVLGDSFIEGLAVPIELGFTKQLETMLQAHVKEARIEVINLGVAGVGPAQYLRMLERRGLAYNPDLVIMAIYPENDYWDSYYELSGGPSKAFYALNPDGTLQYIPPLASKLSVRIRPILRKSAFLTLFRRGIAMTSLEHKLGTWGLLQAPGIASEHSMKWTVYDSSLPHPWPQAYRTTLRTISASNELAHKNSAGFIAMMIGSVAMLENRWDEVFSEYPAPRNMAMDSRQPFEAIVQLGQHEGFTVIDLAEYFASDFKITKMSRSWPHDGHWNSSGHRFAAEIMSAYLLSHRYEYAMPN